MIAALYDIHGNLPALEAVLVEIRRQGVDEVVVGGDVFPGPMPRAALQCLLNLDVPVRFIYGNGDRETLALKRGARTGFPEQYRDVMRWGADELEAGDEQLLASWPGTLRVVTPEQGAILFCHATPLNDTDVFVRTTPDDRLVPLFEAAGANLVVCGHTHMQFDRVIGSVRVVNAGSVGMPFGEPGAYWLLLGSDVQLKRTAYDFERAAERIRRCGYPKAEEFAATSILKPPSEDQMLQVFAGAEISR